MIRFIDLATQHARFRDKIEAGFGTFSPFNAIVRGLIKGKGVANADDEPYAAVADAPALEAPPPPPLG